MFAKEHIGGGLFFFFFEILYSSQKWGLRLGGGKEDNDLLAACILCFRDLPQLPSLL